MATDRIITSTSKQSYISSETQINNDPQTSLFFQVGISIQEKVSHFALYSGNLDHSYTVWKEGEAISTVHPLTGEGAGDEYGHRANRRVTDRSAQHATEVRGLGYGTGLR